jgi:predicted ester cyclase
MADSLLDQHKALAARAASAQCSSAAAAVANKAVEEFFTPDVVIHNTFPGFARGAEGTKRWNAAILEAFPDYQVIVDDQIAEGDKVVTRWTVQGTHKGTFQGIAPTGKHVSITGTTINRYVGQKIAEAWIELDTGDLMRQLGVSSTSQGGKTGLFTFNVTAGG